MEKAYPVIIIGAGISGLAASLSLTKKGINHIILEGRDRIGGRMTETILDGVPIHLGASYVHLAKMKNAVISFMKENHLKYESAHGDSDIYYHQGIGELQESLTDKAEKIYQNLQNAIQKVAEKLEKDISVADAAKNFLEKISAKQQIKNLLNWLLNSVGNDEGAEITQVSARTFMDDEVEFDVVPVGGWERILQKIMNISKPQIFFNQKVIKVDYSTKIIKVSTTQKDFFAQKIISSLPLGILQSNFVTFFPELPNNHQKAIQKLGFGVMNKIFISFQKPFWDTSEHWIYFVTKQWNRYPMALSMIKQNRYILCFFTSGEGTKAMCELTDEDIINDLLNFLKRFNFKQEIKVRAYKLTRWHKDPFSLGSYSFLKVGSSLRDTKTLSQSINKMIWFVGEHCHPKYPSYAHSAFETGIIAGEEVAKVLKQ